MKRPAVPFVILFDVIGRPRMMDGILFVPALLEFDDPDDEFYQILEDYLSAEERVSHLQVVRDELKWHCDLWSRARIAALFHFQPPLRLGYSEKPLNVGFLAISSFDQSTFLTAYPFACVNRAQWEEELNEVGILFSRVGPPQAIRDRITQTFWRLLLQNPDELMPFEQYIYDYGHQQVAGYSKQTFFRPEPEENWYGIDRHTFLHCEQFLCFDCEGCGIEYEYPYTEDCATCGGHGYIDWRFGSSTHSNRWDETAW